VLDFRILGPLEVWRDGKRIALGGVRQRAVLALLLLHANEVVSVDTLVDELWGEDPPADAPAAVQAHVSRVRKVLEPPRTLVTTPPGYKLEVAPQDFDLLRFQELAGRGRRLFAAGDGEQAAASLREALACWRGRPLADLAAEAFAQGPIRALEEFRLDAVAARIDADLACGRHAELIPELADLVRREPLQERLRGQLMLALYRSGRQADALAAYADGRAMLVEQLGLEPGRELRELQAAILRQDRALDVPAPRPTETVTPPPPNRRRRRALAAASAAGTAAAALAITLALGGHDAAAPIPPGAGFVVAVSTKDGAVSGRVPVGATPTAVAVGGGSVWAVNADDQTISRIDPRNRAADTFGIGATPTDIAAGPGAVWVGSGGRVRGTQATDLVATALARFDPATRSPRATVPLPRGRGAFSDTITDHVAVGAGGVWVIGPDARVVRIDPRTDRVAAVIPGVRARAIAIGDGKVWALAEDGTVACVDARTNSITCRGRVSASSVASITAGAGGAWVSAPADGVLWRAVPGAGDRLVMRTIPVAIGTTDLAYGANAVWAVNPLHGTLQRIDTRRDSVLQTIAVGGFPRAVAVGDSTVWVATVGTPAPPATTTSAGVKPVSASSCDPPFYGGAHPAQRLVVSDLPLQGGLRLSSRQMADAIAYVLRQRRFRAGRFRVAYQSCDDALAATRLPDRTKCAANARAFVQAADVVAVVGPLNSDCALAALPELGASALGMVSPLASFTGLTRPAQGAPPGELRTLYPTGRRTFLRVFPNDDRQVDALALRARGLGRGASVYVLDDGDDGYGRVVAAAFERSARGLGLPVAGRGTWDPGAASQRPLADRVARAHPRAVFLGGRLDTGAPAVIRALRAQLGSHVTILATDAVTPAPLLVAKAGHAADGVVLAINGIASSDELGGRGARLARDLARTLGGQTPEPSAVYAAQAMEVVLDALARSDGTRASVLRAMFTTNLADGLIGPVSFDRNGDIRNGAVSLFRVDARKRDAVFDRIVRVG
jgi:DNA-binding SARP family transcriptional activator/ABC-type branched-subunit amino acid transport system substrate-binding protein